MKTEVLSIDLLRIDADTQSRVAINEDTVAEYAEIIQASKEWPFPPLDVFHDGSDYYVADGFHRTLGGIRAKRASCPCNIHKGTARDARIFGMTANDNHGLRMSRADKRACVEWLLDNGGKLTQKVIAELAGVSPRTVQMVIADRKPTPHNNAQVANSPPSQRGKNQDTRQDRKPSGEEETPSGPPRNGTEKPAGKPGKQYSRSDWFRMYEQSIGPVCRLVDKIAEGVREKHDPHHEVIQKHLESATQEMMKWMKVKSEH